MADALVIEMAAPGLKRSNFYVCIDGNIITISFLHKDDQIIKIVSPAPI